MPREKFVVGESVEMLCLHQQAGLRVRDWLNGVVVQVDERMAAVQFATDVFANTGWLIPDRILWAAHGSPHLRRAEVETVVSA